MQLRAQLEMINTGIIDAHKLQTAQNFQEHSEGLQAINARFDKVETRIGDVEADVGGIQLRVKLEQDSRGLHLYLRLLLSSSLPADYKYMNSVLQIGLMYLPLKGYLVTEAEEAVRKIPGDFLCQKQIHSTEWNRTIFLTGYSG